MAQRTLAALEAMNAPLSWAQAGCPKGPVAGRAAVRKGVMHLSGEFGGGGRLDHGALEVAERCVYRLLDHLGILEMEEKWRAEIPTRFVVNSQEHFVYAPQGGVFEPLCRLGETVEAGQLAGYLHRPELPMDPPVELRFKASGLVSVMRSIGRSAPGDCLYHLLGETCREEIVRFMETMD